LAIPSIIFATQVNSKWATGDAAGAMDASAKAKKFGLIGIVIGAVVLVLYVILIVIGAAASSRR
ncbi:MAG: CD225/dispanin family protein, partial [Lapillicoccus sp.]